MTRGNQREIDRARAAARKSAQGTKQAGNPQQVCDVYAYVSE
jgi:hypothetical protein